MPPQSRSSMAKPPRLCHTTSGLMGDVRITPCFERQVTLRIVLRKLSEEAALKVSSIRSWLVTAEAMFWPMVSSNSRTYTSTGPSVLFTHMVSRTPKDV